jgi:hypothetical protein
VDWSIEAVLTEVMVTLVVTSASSFPVQRAAVAFVQRVCAVGRSGEPRVCMVTLQVSPGNVPLAT